jgi:integral membrane protein
VRGALLRYRVMANVIGVFLIVLICIGVPLKHLLTEGSTWQTIGADITEVVGIMHGFLYMIFLVVAADLSRRARFPLWFAVVTLVLGTIPFLSFLGEHNATKRVRSDYPELVPTRAHAA